MNKKVLLPLVILTAGVVMAIPLAPTAQAKITEFTHTDGYKEYLGIMGNASFYVLIPDQWTNPLGNKMLVVICRPAAYTEDPRGNQYGYPFAQQLAKAGIAAAASNWGYGSTIDEGVIRTHQLTMYVIDNFDVTGKVFLWGTSLGGGVALLLGGRNPEVYSGVLDNSGLKDYAASYHDSESYSGSDPFLISYNARMIGIYLGMFGGTPEEKTQKYAKYSPTHYPDMAIPVISLVHAGDMIVKPSQTDLYHAALRDPTLHMIVTITTVTPGKLPAPGATGWYGHFDPVMRTAPYPYLFTLIAWSNTLNP